MSVGGIGVAVEMLVRRERQWMVFIAGMGDDDRDCERRCGLARGEAAWLCLLFVLDTACVWDVEGFRGVVCVVHRSGWAAGAATVRQARGAICVWRCDWCGSSAGGVGWLQVGGCIVCGCGCTDVFEGWDVALCLVCQEEGNFVITFPRSYHGGFNQGELGVWWVVVCGVCARAHLDIAVVQWLGWWFCGSGDVRRDDGGGGGTRRFQLCRSCEFRSGGLAVVRCFRRGAVSTLPQAGRSFSRRVAVRGGEGAQRCGSEL